MKISVITVTLNAAQTVSACLASIQSQSCAVEHIIVDGGSSDATLALIEQQRTPSTRVISEPDQGLYDAMNKGLTLASGDIVGILNADDVYAGREVLEKVADLMEETGADSCYGDLVYVARGGEESAPERILRYWRSGEYSAGRFYRGWMPPHPTFFVRRQVYERLGKFRLDLGTAADYELMLRFLLKGGISTAYLPEVLVKMSAGGVSGRSLANRLKANLMDRRAWKVNGLRPHPWTLLLKPLSKLGQLRLGWEPPTLCPEEMFQPQTLAGVAAVVPRDRR